VRQQLHRVFLGQLLRVVLGQRRTLVARVLHVYRGPGTAGLRVMARRCRRGAGGRGRARRQRRGRPVRGAIPLFAFVFHRIARAYRVQTAEFYRLKTFFSLVSYQYIYIYIVFVVTDVDRLYLDINHYVREFFGDLAIMFFVLLG